MSVVRLLPIRGEWLIDARGDGERALRVSWHHEVGAVVLSTWREGRCVGTVRLAPAEAAHLVAVLAAGLGELAAQAAERDAPGAAVVAGATGP